VKAILLILLATSIAVPSIYAVNLSLTVHNTGNFGVVGIFSDINLTKSLVNGNIQWNTLFPGTLNNQTVYIKNYGGQPVNVTMTVDNWNPINASQYMTVTWDHEGSTLGPGVAEACQIFVQVFDNATSSGIGGFSFDIHINPTW
jgi:hypothetical protein